MPASELRLVSRTAGGPPARRQPLRVLALAAVLAVAAGVSGLIGVGAARQPIAALDLVAEAARRAIQYGNDDTQVEATLVDLRRSLGRRPLDSRTRVSYAGLLLGISRTIDDTAAAAAHAARAAQLAPVTVPVVRGAVRVLASSGRRPEALALMREMFSYAPHETAKLLADVAPVLYADEVGLALPDDPDAWFAWARELRSRGRVLEASTRLDQALRRWPDHLPSLRQVAEAALRQRDWDRLGELFPAGRELPDDPLAAPVLACRARYRAGAADSNAARADIERALSLDGGSATVRALAGDAFRSMGSVDEARKQWQRALFLLPAEQTARRQSILVRLARLEERQGVPSRALQLWAEILEVDPEHAEARRRMEELTDF